MSLLHAGRKSEIVKTSLESELPLQTEPSSVKTRWLTTQENYWLKLIALKLIDHHHHVLVNVDFLYPIDVCICPISHPKQYIACVSCLPVKFKHKFIKHFVNLAGMRTRRHIFIIHIIRSNWLISLWLGRGKSINVKIKCFSSFCWGENVFMA